MHESVIITDFLPDTAFFYGERLLLLNGRTKEERALLLSKEQPLSRARLRGCS